ncbi:ATP-binding cassette domain-containing protein [Mycoplasma sp. 128]
MELNNVIKFINFSGSYTSSKSAQLHNINTEIQKSDFLAIIGPSGAGKSTFLNAIFKELKSVSGDIEFENISIYKMTKKQRKNMLKNIAYFSQENILIENDTVLKSIAREYFFSFLTAKRFDKINSILKELNLADKKYEPIAKLSGGQKQRLQLAKLFLKKKDLFLIDEPTNNLDIKMSDLFVEKLQKLHSEQNITIVAIMHDISLVKKYFKHYIAIKNGTIFSQGKVQLLSEQEIQKIFE